MKSYISTPRDFALVVFVLCILTNFDAFGQLDGSDTLPGSSCAGFPVGATRLTADANDDGNQVTLICNGSIWEQGGVVVLQKSGAPPTPDGGGVASDVTPAGSDGEIQFNDGGLGLGASSNLFWDAANSRLGIGTSAPSVGLHYDGDEVRFQVGSNGNLRITPNFFYWTATQGLMNHRIFNSGERASLEIGFDQNDNETTGQGFINFLNNGSNASDVVGSISYLEGEDVFKINAGDISGFDLVIDSSGNIGIGNPSPSVSLDVVGKHCVHRIHICLVGYAPETRHP